MEGLIICLKLPFQEITLKKFGISVGLISKGWGVQMMPRHWLTKTMG